MVDYTSNLKLVLPIFGETPWDEEVNSNFTVLDAAVGRFFGVANLTGVWKNDTLYVQGQSTVDGTDGSIWTCVINNTSPPVPITFPQDRLDRPGNWVAVVSAARDYAIAAQNSASSAASSATAAAGSAANAANSATVVSGAVPISGGTMTGLLVLSGDPTNVLGAVTKQYVDARVGGTGYLPLTGGSLTGALTLVGNPAAPLQAAPKQYVDLFLPLTGGTLSGNLATGGQVNAGTLVANSWVYSATGFYHSVGGLRLQQDANYSYIFFDTNNWNFLYTRANGRLSYRNGASTELFAIDPGGSITAAGNVSGLGLYCNGSGARVVGDANTTYWFMDAGSWRWQYARNSGVIQYVRSDGAALFTVDASGNVSAASGLFSVNGVYPHSADAAFNMNASGGVRAINFQSGWALQWFESDGGLAWIAGGSAFVWWLPGPGYLQNNRGPMVGTGAYINVSDESTKEDILPNPYGIEEVREIEPIIFRREDKTHNELGFSAQDVQQHIPEAATVLPNGLMAVASEMLTSVLWNAVREIDARLLMLEGPDVR